VKEQLHPLFDMQHTSGAFPSYIQLDNTAPLIQDLSCFATALVVLSLVHRKDSSHLTDTMIERALDFLETCQLPDRSFCFYPPGSQGRWLPIQLPPDLDDTAVCLLALYLCGRRDRRAVEQAIGSVVRDSTVGGKFDWDPAWVGKGAFRTWLSPAVRHNLVDCCVNANVAALHAALDMKNAAYGAACSAVKAGLQAVRPVRINNFRQICPYYSHPIELLYAVDRAVSAGAHDLEVVSAELRAESWSRVDVNTNWDPMRPLFGNRTEFPVWRSPALQKARRFATTESR
jgi:hypothetical protein